MAITRNKKEALVTELANLLKDAKGTVGAKYSGLSVADLQELRKMAREVNVSIRVVKNRLIRVALGQNPTYKDADTQLLKGQLVYAFSSEDELAPAQVLAAFAKKHPTFELIAGFSMKGESFNTATVKMLSELPTKDQLRGQLVSVIAAPLTNTLRVLNGTQSGFVRVLSEKSKA
jgi:large subunit ribosomal protein L10